MNIFNKVTLEFMKKSRTRTLVTILGVILSSVMITAVVTFAFSLQKYMVNGAILKYGSWQVEFLDVDSSFVQDTKNDTEVSNSVSIKNIGYANLTGGENPDKPYLFIAGFNNEDFDNLPLNIISGRLPQSSSEILVPAHVYSNGGVKYEVGDTFTLDVGSRVYENKNLCQHDPYVSKGSQEKETLNIQYKKTYTVVGICQRPKFEEYSAPGYTLITAIDSKDTEEGSYSTFVTLKNPYRVHTYAESKAKTHYYVFNDDVLRFMGLSDNNMFNTFLYSVGGVLVILIMIGSVFLIYNSFNISLNERTRQFGILSSIGATEKQLKNSVLFEGLIIGVIAIPIGIILGILSIDIVISFVSDNFLNFAYSTVPLKLNVSSLAIIIASSVSLVTILISAYIPAKKAANTPVIENIKQINNIKIESKHMKISKISQNILSFEAVLALKNFKRNKKRYKSIVLSLTLSVVLFVSCNSFGTYLKQSIEKSVVDCDYDICFSSKNIDEEKMFNLYNEFKDIDGIYESSYQDIISYSCKVNKSDFSDRFKVDYSDILQDTNDEKYDLQDENIKIPMDIQFIEDSKYFDFIKRLGLSKDEYTGENAKMIAAAKFKYVDDINDKSSELINMFSNSTMNCSISPEVNNNIKIEDEKNINITFVDTIPLDCIPRNDSKVKQYTFIIVAPYGMKRQFETSYKFQEIGLTFKSNNPSESVDKMEEIIQGAGITSDYNLDNLYEIFEENRNILFVVNVFTYVFVIMISLIAIANVFNTISTNIKLRRRELAMLLSVGMSNRDFKKMMNFECLFYGMRTLIFGIPICVISSYLIYKGFVSGGAEINFVFPYLSIIISVFFIFFIVFITMIYSTSKIKKENIIDALRDDME